MSRRAAGRLTETAHFVDELLNRSPTPHQPYVGSNAFAHKGGMHVAGINADARPSSTSSPALVGNDRDLLISELSGTGTVPQAPSAPASSSTTPRPRA